MSVDCDHDARGLSVCQQKCRQSNSKACLPAAFVPTRPAATLIPGAGEKNDDNPEQPLTDRAMVFTFKERAGQILFQYLLFLLIVTIATGSIEVVSGAGRGASFLAGLPSVRLGIAAPLNILVRSPQFLFLIVTGILLSTLLPVLSPAWSSLLALLSALPFLYTGFMASAEPALIPMEFGFLAILLLYAVDFLFEYFRETRMKQQIISVFGQYIPPQLVTEITRKPAQLNLTGEARELSVCFTDLRDFSGVAEQLNPRQLTLLLNDYFTAMTKILYQHGATIDKYIGDSIMAFWGAPVCQDDHARHAVLAALEMQEEIRTLSEKFVRRGWPALSMGVGINTGIMNVGNMGSKYRIAYTVIGDAVNLASRLQTLTRTYMVPCIVSETTRNAADDILFRVLDLVQVKGKHNKTWIYQPLCREAEADEALLDRLQLHREGMDHYFNRQAGQARKIFEQLAGRDPADGFYRLMLDKLS